MLGEGVREEIALLDNAQSAVREPEGAEKLRLVCGWRKCVGVCVVGGWVGGGVQRRLRGRGETIVCVCEGTIEVCLCMHIQK